MACVLLTKLQDMKVEVVEAQPGRASFTWSDM